MAQTVSQATVPGAPFLSVQGAPVFEGDFFPGTLAEITFSLDRPATERIEVQFAVVSGTALVPFDIEGESIRTVVFNPGDLSTTATVRTVSNNNPEDDTSFTIETSVVSGTVNLENGAPLLRETIFLLDDDGQFAPESITVSSPFLTEGDGGTLSADFEILLSRPAASGFTMTYETIDGSAKAGSDYAARSGTLTFVAGQQRAVVSVDVTGDTRAEGHEGFSLVVNPPGAYGTPLQGYATILDNDTDPSAPTIAIHGNDIVEGDFFPGDSSTIALILSEPTAAPVTLGYRIIPVTAFLGSDIIYLGDSEVTFLPGQQVRYLTARTTSDSTPEPDEAFIVETFVIDGDAVAPVGTTVAQDIVWILDDDGSFSPDAIAVTSPRIVEGATGTTSMIFDISLSRPADQDFSIGYRTVDTGSATAGEDFVAISGSIAVERGQREFSVEVKLLGDTDFESDESFLLSLTPGLALNGLLVGTGTIANDDDPPPVATGGNDLLDYSNFTGPQTIDALAGDDTVLGGSGADVVNGNAGNDTLRGNAGNDRLFGDVGRDRLQGGAGTDRLYGGAEADDLFGGSGGDSLFGGGGSDTLFGQDGGDVLAGGGGSDVMFGGAGADILLGGAGGDVLVGGGGADVLDGGGGIDTISYGSDAEGVSVYLFNGYAQGGEATGDTLRNVENIVGGSGNDVLLGDGRGNLLVGGGGIDFLSGLGGADTLVGRGGDDTLLGGQGGDVLNGNGGSDTISYTADRAGVEVYLFSGLARGGEASGDRFSNVENVLGGLGNDVLLGDDGANILIGSGGIDFLSGLAGADRIAGGVGNDTLLGGRGADSLNGGAGIDTISYTADRAGVRVQLFNGTAQGGEAQGDRFFQVENVLGGLGNDVLFGDGGANFLVGSGGRDVLSGLGGDDRLAGGAGADVFVFQDGFGQDTVNDFRLAQAGERISLAEVSQIRSFSDLRTNHLSTTDDGFAQITAGSDTIVLRGVEAGALTADDFLF